MALGIFDSGVGGLTVWRALRPIMTEHTIYFGDTVHIPYGEKTQEQLVGYFQRALAFFVQRQASAVVVACNTASAVALPRVKEPPVPLFSMIDAAVRQALAVTKGRVGVLATRATTESGVYPKAFQAADPGVEVVSQACPKLAPLIEAGFRRGEVVESAVAEYVTPLLQAQVDTIVLGCTHYPFVLPEIRRQVGPEIHILDPAEEIRAEVAEFLRDRKPECQPGECRTEFWVSGDPWQFRDAVKVLMGLEIPAVQRYHVSGDVM